MYQIVQLLCPLFPTAFISKCKIEGKGKPVRGVPPVQPLASQRYFCCILILFLSGLPPDAFDGQVKNIEVGQTFIPAYLLSELILQQAVRLLGAGLPHTRRCCWGKSALPMSW